MLVPDGRYVAPGLGLGGLRKENASDDNIERELLILTLLEVTQENMPVSGVNSVIWGLQ